jgi:hypothetical protein
MTIFTAQNGFWATPAAHKYGGIAFGDKCAGYIHRRVTTRRQRSDTILAPLIATELRGE